MSSLIGRITHKKYILIKEIGKGEFCHVWLGLNFPKHLYVAIKIFDKENVSTGLEELKHLRNIKKNKCRSCISFIETFCEDKLFFIVQELLAGSLYSIMKEQYPTGFPSETVLKIAEQLLTALNDIHTEAKIIHADLKPENILLVGRTLEMEKLIQYIDKEIKFPKTIHQASNRIKSLFEGEKPSESETGTDTGEEDSILTDSDIQSEHDDGKYEISSDEEDNKIRIPEEIIDEKYILNPKVVLSDFGNCLRINKLHDLGDIQTRHYRAPEIILRLKLDEKVDIWAFGCLIFELMTGKVLFNPHKSIGVSCDLQQLYDMQCLFGDFPKYFLTSRKKSVFFKSSGLLQHFSILKPVVLKELFDSLTKNKENKKIYQIIEMTLKYEPEERPTAKQII